MRGNASRSNERTYEKRALAGWRTRSEVILWCLIIVLVLPVAHLTLLILSPLLIDIFLIKDNLDFYKKYITLSIFWSN